MGVLGVGFALLGCSGKYVVGTMDQPDGSGGRRSMGAVGGDQGMVGYAGTVAVAGTYMETGGTSFVGTAGTAFAGESSGGSMPTGGNGARVGVGESCVGGAAPKFVLEAPIAPTPLIWQRVSKLVFGNVMVAMPADLPPMLNEDELMGMVDQAFATLQAKNSYGATAGAGLFIQEWLNLASPLDDSAANYDVRMDYDSNDVFPILLESMHLGNGLGVFTESAWLARHPSISSRGNAVMVELFGMNIPPPPPGSIMNGMPDPMLPDRQALEMQVSAPVCNSCHRLVDPPGYALGMFDSAGQYRTQDHGQPIDTSGSVRLQLEQRDVPFKDYDELMHIAEGSCDATVALADAFLRFAMHQSGYDDASVSNVPQADRERIEKNFSYENRSYPSLVRAYLQTSVGHGP
jgi:hypothetical protein